MYCVQTQDLSHRFSKNETALNNIHLQVSKGSIYGFLGPNGAGKTTTLRLVLGLLKKQQGSITLFGQPFENNRKGILKKIGSLIESPSLYSQLTALENLRVLQRVYRCPASRMNEVLELVGLPNTGSKKAGSFSLGMKQRLSIAMALLHEPELLILDEPTNGLDPNGILEMRELLKRLNQERSITVLVSSHLLAEVEKLVTHVGLIHKGAMLFQGTLGELMSRQQQAQGVLIETGDNGRALQLVGALQPAARMADGGLLLPFTPREGIAAINTRLVQNGVAVYGISQVKNDLESVFMSLTNN